MIHYRTRRLRIAVAIAVVTMIACVGLWFLAGSIVSPRTDKTFLLGARVCACVAVVIGMVIVFKRTPMTGITFGDDGVTFPSGLFANWADVTAIRTIDDYVVFDTVDANRYVANPRFQPVTRRLMERFGTPLAFNVVGFHASLTEIVDTARRLSSASAKRRD